MSSQDYPERPLPAESPANEPVEAAPPETNGVCAVSDTDAPGELLVFNEEKPDSEWIALDAPVEQLAELTWALCPFCGHASSQEEWDKTTWECPECEESARFSGP